MLPRVRLAGATRLAAALVTVALSGAPRVLALHAPVEEHRCSCRAQRGEHHECECAICRKAALTAQAQDEKAPPCHRGAARKALSEQTRQGSRSVPCFEGTCGGSGQPKMTPAGVEPFCMPAARAVALEDRTERRPALIGAVREAPIEPETPPPRAT